jgi:hypothetical protein
MQKIMITRPDGSVVPIADRRTATAIKSAQQTWELLGNDVVSITVESPFPQTYSIGDRITVFGRHYKLHRLPKARKTGTHAFSYDLEFEGVQYDLMRATYDLTIETTNNQLQDVQADSLTGDLHRFATVLIANANRVFPGVWALGNCPETEDGKTLTFGESGNCLSALQVLCPEFGVEFEIVQADGISTINFSQKVGQIFPHTFQFGKGRGLYSLDRQNVDSSNIVTRLKVYGSTSNITHKYRANRLCLPGCGKGQSFIEKPEAVAKYGIYEATKYFDDVKPTFNGVVSKTSVENVLQFADDNMFDLNTLEPDGITTKYMLAGVSAKIHFNSGNLAGYEFDVHSYDHATRTFTLVEITDERDDHFPSKTSPAFQFAAGDKYKILDVAMPPEYEAEAENRLANEGDIYYDQNSQPKVQYSLSVTAAYLKRLAGSGTTVNIFAPGDYIPVKDDDIDVDKSVRIQSLTRNLLDEYDYSLTISDTVSSALVNRVISELTDLDKIVTANKLKNPARARANWRTSREVLNMVFDPDGDYYTNKIKPESIDTIALSVGAKSMQFGLTNTVLQPNYDGDKNTIRVTGGVLTHYTIDENSARSWTLADNVTVFDADATAYYIYARCGRAGEVGSIIFTPDQIRPEQDASYYHFWIGVVNSVDAELQARSVALSYGFSMINGRFIKTGRIESADGKTWFDLDTGEISGRITFIGAGGGRVDVEDGFDYLQNEIDSLIIEGYGSLNFLTEPGQVPMPPYNRGDTWSNTVDLRICVHSKAEDGIYEATDWILSTAYDNTKTTVDGGLVTSGTVQLAGPSGSILAGITGDGTAADSVRIWAGASFADRATAPFRVMQDGRAVIANAEVTGVLNATSGTFRNVTVHGSIRSEFTQLFNVYDIGFNDNIVLPSAGGSYWELPWDAAQSGRKMTLVNYKWGNAVSTGWTQISAPGGKYFFENGISKASIRLSREAVEIIGYGDASTFYGWIVFQRITLMSTYAYGRQFNMLAMGYVAGTSSGASISHTTFDGKTLSVSRLGTGQYRVSVPNGWFQRGESLMVMLTGNGFAVGTNNPLKATLLGKTTEYFDVHTSDDATLNDGSFLFWINNFDDWT